MNIIQRIINFIKKLILKDKISGKIPYYRSTTIPTRKGSPNKEAPNARELWTLEDTERMLKMANDEVPHRDIGYVLGRTKHSISARIYELKHKKSHTSES